MKNLPELAIRYRTITLFITTLLMAKVIPALYAILVETLRIKPIRA